METYQYIQKKEVNVLMGFVYFFPGLWVRKRYHKFMDFCLRGHILEPNFDDFDTKSS